MSELGKEQLEELHEQINARLAEFGLITMPALSRGAVRIAHAVIRQYYEQRGAAWA